MNDHDALVTAIIEHPDEDTPRLMFADWCDEHDRPARAEFVRTQIQLHHLGPVRRTLKNLLGTRHGADYYEFDINDDDGVPRVGDRVDITGELAAVMTPTSKRKRWYGLLVHKITPIAEAPGSYSMVVKRDADSKPFPHARYNELVARCRALLVSHWRDWTPPGVFDFAASQAGPWELSLSGARLFPLGDTGLEVCAPCRHTYPGYALPKWDFVRGFVGRVRCHWWHWLHAGDRLCAAAPVDHVVLFDAPRWVIGAAGVVLEGDPRGPGSLMPWDELGVAPLYRPGVTRGDWDTWVEDHLDEILAHRWPHVPPDHWTIADPTWTRA